MSTTSAQPPRVLQPRSVDELGVALRDSRGVVAVHGAGTKARWGAAGADAGVVVETGGLASVVEHAVDDLVVTAQAGVRLRDLQAQVGEHRQWLALDPPEQDGTLGGTLATAAFGPRRLRFGTPRDLVLGVTVVLGDGTVARSGGKVVKNVAGYDLGKLFTGSFGTLGVIAQVTLRLHPALVARRLVSVDCAQPWSLVRDVLRSPATPTAIEWYDGRLHVLVESSEAAVDAQAATVAALLSTKVADALPQGFGARPWAAGDLAVKVTFRLSALDEAIAAVHEAFPRARVRAHAGSGVLHAAIPPSESSATPDPSMPEALDGLRRRIATHDGAVVVIDAPDEVKSRLDVWGPVRGLPVMRRIKDQFDPQGRMNRGRFVGGI